MSVLVRAQAKINLHLAVLGREVSGYHSIETVFHRIELADDVIVQLAAPGTREVRCSVDVGPMRENLAYRAAVMFLEATGWETGFDIQIVKRIPAGGGLGGGSADAAATLRGLNALNPAPAPDALVMAIAGRLGADVPFLASDAVMALAWGRGERMLALDPLPRRFVALVVPPVRVATAEAYAWLDDARGGAGRVPGPLPAGLRLRNALPAEAQALSPPHPPEYEVQVRELRYWHLANWEGLIPHAGNDFEPVVAERFSEVSAVVAALKTAGATMAGMTGSGSTLFGIFETSPDLRVIEEATGCQVVITETATSHPAPVRETIAAPIRPSGKI